MVIFAWHLFTNAYLLVWMSSQRPGEGPGASPRTKGDRIFARVLKFHNRYTMDSTTNYGKQVHTQARCGLQPSFAGQGKDKARYVVFCNNL